MRLTQMDHLPKKERHSRTVPLTVLADSNQCLNVSQKVEQERRGTTMTARNCNWQNNYHFRVVDLESIPPIQLMQSRPECYEVAKHVRRILGLILWSTSR